MCARACALQTGLWSAAAFEQLRSLGLEDGALLLVERGRWLRVARALARRLWLLVERAHRRRREVLVALRAHNHTSSIRRRVSSPTPKATTPKTEQD